MKKLFKLLVRLLCFLLAVYISLTYSNNQSDKIRAIGVDNEIIDKLSVAKTINIKYYGTDNIKKIVKGVDEIIAIISNAYFSGIIRANSEPIYDFEFIDNEGELIDIIKILIFSNTDTDGKIISNDVEIRSANIDYNLPKKDINTLLELINQ